MNRPWFPATSRARLDLLSGAHRVSVAFYRHSAERGEEAGVSTRTKLFAVRGSYQEHGPGWPIFWSGERGPARWRPCTPPRWARLLLAIHAADRGKPKFTPGPVDCLQFGSKPLVRVDGAVATSRAEAFLSWPNLTDAPLGRPIPFPSRNSAVAATRAGLHRGHSCARHDRTLCSCRMD